MCKIGLKPLPCGGGGVANGDVPLDGVAFLRLD